MNEPNNLLVACSLTTAELDDREAALLSQFISRATETEELRNGYAFRLPGDSSSIRLVMELVVAERECCPFMTVELVAQPNKGPVVVRLTGPDGTKEFLRTILWKQASTDSIQRVTP